jgi:hypothetical protein
VRYLAAKPHANDVWLLGHAPTVCYALHAHAPTKYLDFRMAYHKLACFATAAERTRYSQVEPEADFFEALQKKKPHYIVDSADFFVTLQRRYPTLFERYKPTKIGGFTVYQQV